MMHSTAFWNWRAPEITSHNIMWPFFSMKVLAYHKIFYKPSNGRGLRSLAALGKAEDLAQNLVSSIPEQSRGDIEDMVLAYLDDRLAMDHIQSVTQKARFFEEIIAEPDNVRALTWWILASAINMQTAVSRRNDLIDDMTPEDVLDAQIEAQKIFTEENFTGRFIKKSNSAQK